MNIKAKQISGLIAKSLGLLNKDPRIIFFTTYFGIHTFGLSYSIDVLILDHSQYVRIIKTGLEPNKIFFWLPLYNQVLELPTGTVQKMGIKLGTHLNLEFI